MTELTTKPLRILFAPHEIGGQMQLMVEELRRRGHFATAASYTQEWFGHVNDVNLNLNMLKNNYQKHARTIPFTIWAAQNYDIFHFFWGESLFGFGPFMHIDLPILKNMGKKIFVHFRGLDVIDLKYFDYLRSKTAGDDIDEPPISRPEQLKSLAKWRKYADRMLISEPDLFRVVPEAELVQQAVGLDYWQSSGKPPRSTRDGIIRIAHAPSMRRKKGTEFVVKSVAELKEMGYPVELVLIEKVPYNEVKDLYEMCDIGVDQVLYGWDGKTSIELMALGKPVVCYINPEWLHFRPELPVQYGYPIQLTRTLARLVADADLRNKLGSQGIAYVKKNHDVRVVIDQCLKLYQSAE